MKFSLVAAVLFISSVLAMGVAADDVASTGGDVGIYRIHCNVEGARVYFDSELKGTISEGTLNVPVNITGSPPQTFSLEKEGYYPYPGRITAVPSKGTVVHLYVTMSAIPPVSSGTLHLLVSPPLSSVSLDGESRGDVPGTGILVLREVMPGNHRVQVSMQGYATNTTEVYLASNEIKKISIVLEAADNGPLSVISIPPGAAVYLDDQFVGSTPLTLPEVQGGSHRVGVKMNGYKDFLETVSVTRAGVTVSAALEAEQAEGSTRAGLPVPLVIGAILGTVLLLGKSRYLR